MLNHKGMMKCIWIKVSHRDFILHYSTIYINFMIEMGELARYYFLGILFLIKLVQCKRLKKDISKECSMISYKMVELVHARRQRKEIETIFESSSKLLVLFQQK